MTDLLKKQPIKIRTFAADLEAVRQKREEVKAPAVPTAPILPEEPEEELGKIRIKTTKHPAPIIKSTPIKKLPEVAIVEPTAIKNAGLSNVKKIPSFHELQKQVKAIQDTTAHTNEKTAHPIPKFTHKESPTETPTEPHRPNIGYDSTIITDTKSDDFNVFTSVIASIKSWFEKKKVEHKKKKMPLYSVPNTDRRKGVIQKATTKTATVFSTDNNSIKEQIKKRNQKEVEEKNNQPETTWSPFTDSVFSLLEAPDPAENIRIDYKKFSQPTQPPIAKTPEVTIAPLATEIIEDVSEPVVERAVVETVPEVVVEQTPIESALESEPELADDVFSEERWASSHDDETINNEDAVNHEFAVVNNPTYSSIDTNDIALGNEELPERKSFFSKIDPNTSIIILLVIIASLIVIIITARIIMSNKLSNQEQPVAVVTSDIEPIIKQATPVSITLDTNSIKNYANLINTTIEGGPAGIIELATLSPNGTEISGSYIFDLLSFRTIPNLRHSLTATRFVSINHGAPAILLQFVDPDTVTGAILQWETTIIIDTNSFYKIPYEVKPAFTDSVVNGINVRVLSHQEKVVLVYGLINDHTAIITNNVEDFTQISKQELTK